MTHRRRLFSVPGPAFGGLLFSALLGFGGLGCGAEGAATNTPGPVSPTAAPTSSAAPYTPRTPVEESRTLLEQSKTTSDARERCLLVSQAVLLDSSSAQAHLARAKNGCAPARELLDDARAAHKLSPSSETATTLVIVAARAESAADAISGAQVLLTPPTDLERQRLAARTLARFGEHERAARAFERIASERGGSGAGLDALDARLDAVMESARCGGKGALAAPRADLIAAIQAAVPLSAGYGAAWIGPKIVEAIAVLRTSGGDDKGASDGAKLARESKVIVAGEASIALDAERGIAEARAGKKGALAPLLTIHRSVTRSAHPSSRALLAVEAKLSGKCGAARAYARAHDSLPKEAMPRFDEDLAWARDCKDGEIIATLATPRPSPDVEDASALSLVDPLRGRALLQKIVDGRPDDVAARLALAHATPSGDRLASIDSALAKLPSDPALHLARFELLVGKPRLDEASQIAKTILPTTIEVLDDGRAAVPVLSRLIGGMEQQNDTLGARADLAEALIKACAAPMEGPACVDKKDDALVKSAALLRAARPAALAKWGPSLSNADLAEPRVRLDVVLALVTDNQLIKAETIAGKKRGAWESPEAGLASAAVLAAAKKCELAKAKIAQWPNLATTYPDEVAVVAKKCK